MKNLKNIICYFGIGYGAVSAALRIAKRYTVKHGGQTLFERLLNRNDINTKPETNAEFIVQLILGLLIWPLIVASSLIRCKDE